MNQLLTTQQVSQIIGFDVRTVRKWCDEGNVFPTARKIPDVKTGQWRILSDDVALLSMVDGQDANTAMLADTNHRLTALETENQQLVEKITWHQGEYNKLVNTYNTLLNEATELDQAIANQQAQITEQQALITDLQRYKDHYLQQKRRQGSQKGQRQGQGQGQTQNRRAA